MFPGRMMDYPLTVTHFLERARTLFADAEVVSRAADGTPRRDTYGGLYRRVSKLASALGRIGARPGDPLRHGNHLRVAVRKLRRVIEDDAAQPTRLVTTDEGYVLRGLVRLARANASTRP